MFLVLQPQRFSCFINPIENFIVKSKFEVPSLHKVKVQIWKGSIGTEAVTRITWTPTLLTKNECSSKRVLIARQSR